MKLSQTLFTFKKKIKIKKKKDDDRTFSMAFAKVIFWPRYQMNQLIFDKIPTSIIPIKGD